MPQASCRSDAAKKILKCIKKQNVESAKNTKKCGRCLQQVIKFFFETKRSKPKKMLAKKKNGVVESRFPVWHYAFGLSYREISATEFNCVRQQRTWQRWGHVDASKAKNANARNIRDDGVVSIYPSPRRCVDKYIY